MGIFRKKLTNESIKALDEFRNAIELRSDLDNILAALHQAKLLEYHSKNEIGNRFGSRPAMDTSISYIFGVINGMANEIERLKRELDKKSAQKPLL
jgi:hypothetical protein